MEGNTKYHGGGGGGKPSKYTLSIKYEKEGSSEQKLTLSKTLFIVFLIRLLLFKYILKRS
jgi:hypothetical protein